MHVKALELSKITNEQWKMYKKNGTLKLVSVKKTDNPFIAYDCSLCLDKPPEMLFIPCGHVCVCEECINDLKTYGKQCPICQEYFTDAIKVLFVANKDDGKE